MPPKATVARLKAIKRKHAAALLRRPGVAGVDIAIDDDGHGTLAVHVDTKDPRVIKSLPNVLDGVPVEYAYTGPIRKQ